MIVELVAKAIFFARAGVQAKVVPGFHSGAEMVTSVIGHPIDFGFVNLNEAMLLYEGKRLRILAVSSPARSPSLPDIPTFRDLGYDVAIGVWRTLAAPKATPQPTLDKLSTALKQALDARPEACPRQVGAVGRLPRSASDAAIGDDGV